VGAVVTIIQTPKGWEVVAKDATHLRVEVVGDEVIVKVRPTPDTQGQPLDVTLAQ